MWIDRRERDDEGTIDLFEFEVVSFEQGMGIGADGLYSVMGPAMRAVVIDLVNDILDTGRFPQARGASVATSRARRDPESVPGVSSAKR